MLLTLNGGISPGDNIIVLLHRGVGRGVCRVGRWDQQLAESGVSDRVATASPVDTKAKWRPGIHRLVKAVSLTGPAVVTGIRNGFSVPD